MKKMLVVLATLGMVFGGVSAAQAAPLPPNTISGLFYSGHVQDVGWTKTVTDGATVGTTGQSKRLEAISFVDPLLTVQAHVQDIGWQAPVQGGYGIAGTVGKGLRMEAVKLTGRTMSDGSKRSISCRAHVENISWTPWVSDGQVCGTVGKGLRLEALQIVMANK